LCHTLTPKRKNDTKPTHSEIINKRAKKPLNHAVSSVGVAVRCEPRQALCASRFILHIFRFTIADDRLAKPPIATSA
jgi:hypothetical protein